MSDNLLDRETSPYLLQHRTNPVHWRSWGPEALDAAKQGDRPVLLSVGYAACHWCHVMAHECFEHEATAALMNRLFVNIKVDREERPDIDAIYQRALAHMGQSGGWPLTMFLTPAGEPFFGGTYFPREPRYGRPGFAQVLEAVADYYRNQPDKVAESVGALRAALAEMSRATAGGALPPRVAVAAAERLAQEFDPIQGGVGGAPKFPNPSILELLWRAGILSGNAALGDRVTLTLDRMSQGGIYDHLGGGYARYSTDAAWLVPHFEKMLYDNAQLVDLLTWAWQETRSPLYATRVAETVAWIAREMIAEGGGFAATLDADSEGEEGRFYVWSAAEIDAVLGAAAAPFKTVYDVTPGGNWEGHTILNRNHPAGALLDAAAEAALARSRALLLATRAARVRPGWDDKVLADWNGLMIAALAHAGAVFDQPQWVALARTACDFVIERMTAAGRLGHSWRAGILKHTATLDDYAFMIRGALALHEVTGEDRFLAAAQGWVDILDRHYWDPADGGYYFTADDAEALIVRAKSAHDTATPSGNGVMAAQLATLHALTGERRYRDRAEAVIAAFSGELDRNVFPLATLMNAAVTLAELVHVVIVGERDADDTAALRRAAFLAPLPDRLVSVIADGAMLPTTHPAHGKSRSHGRATAYVCARQTCAPPVTDADALAALLRSANPGR